jgi:hypothetical protein
MIRIFNEVLTGIRTKITPVTISREYTKMPAAFPHVTMREIDNTVYRPSQDFQTVENDINWACQIDVYSNINSGAESQCEGILDDIDDYMAGIGMTRFAYEWMDSGEGVKIKRLVARYSGTVSSNKTVIKG